MTYAAPYLPLGGDRQDARMAHIDLAALAAVDDRFDPEAFRFVAGALQHALELAGKAHLSGPERHLDAHELVAGIVDLAARRFGLLGDLVLAQWGLRRGEDIGAVVFRMVEEGVLSKRPHDRIEDFYGVAPLAQALRQQVRHHIAEGE